MIAPDQITKNLDTGLITFFQDGFVVGSCKDTCVIQPINFKSSNNNRGFVVFTGAPQSPENTRYGLIEISIDNLVKITVGTTDTNFTPPSSLPPLYDPTTYRTAYNAVFALLSSKVFRSCCPTVVNVTGEAVLFYDTYGDLPATGLPDILYVVEDGSGAFIWSDTNSSYEPIFYPHSSLTMFGYSNFV